MNPFEMVVLIVAIVMIASVIRSKHHHRASTSDNPAERLEAERLLLVRVVLEATRVLAADPSALTMFIALAKAVQE